MRELSLEEIPQFIDALQRQMKWSITLGGRVLVEENQLISSTLFPVSGTIQTDAIKCTVYMERKQAKEETP